MVAKTTKTVRVTEIPLSVTPEEVASFAARLSTSLKKKTTYSSASCPTTKQWTPPTSLCKQFGYQVGTITLPSAKHRQNALVTSGTGWQFDDVFDEVTVLHDSLSPTVDICAVHGLNENAFETWSSGNIMWLRDLLPHTAPFDSTRIMTYGYNCERGSKGAALGLKGWADDLLRQLCLIRTTDEEKTRPLILLCHSLGGLVAREAMIQLNNYSQLYENISLKRCALLFLSTPHSGLTEANWNKYLVDIAQLGFGLRSNQVTITLRSHNPQSVNSREEFESLNPKPPYICLYETQSTNIRGLNCQIVNQKSATLASTLAVPVPEVDHRSICKVDSKFNGNYRLIVKHLIDLKAQLDGRDTKSSAPKPQIGRPPPTAHRYPNPAGRRFYAGKGLRPTNRIAKLQGRKDDHADLDAKISECQEDSGAVAITGIGGIGKTEMLLNAAYQRLDQTNIFFLRASTDAMLKEAYLHVAIHIGPEVLLYNYQGRDTRDIWSRMPGEEKIEILKEWLSHPDNADTLVMLDDLDGLGDPEVILSAIPQGAKTILFSTRSPTLREEIDRDCKHLRLWSMETEDIIDIMEATVKHSDYEQDGELYNRSVLREIAKAVYGHPLAASHAIKYTIRVISQEPVDSPAEVLLAILSDPNHETRAAFLNYKPRAPSIMDTFFVSRNRLPDPNGLAWRLMQFLSILETDSSVADYRNFFYKRQCVITPSEFSDHELLSNCGPKLSEAFADLEAVSFGERVKSSKPFRFHPLWLECARHAMGEKGRFEAVRQVLLVCHRTIEGPVTDGERKNALKGFLPHIRHCVRVCETFGIDLRSFQGHENTLLWYHRGEKLSS